MQPEVDSHLTFCIISSVLSKASQIFSFFSGFKKNEKLGIGRLPLSLALALAASSIISNGEARKCLFIEASLLLRISISGSKCFFPVVTPTSCGMTVVLLSTVNPSLSSVISSAGSFPSFLSLILKSEFNYMNFDSSCAGNGVLCTSIRFRGRRKRSKEQTYLWM